MVEIAVSDLAPELRPLAVKARQAAEQGESAVVRDLCRQVLSQQPGCVGVRKLWFEMELQAGTRSSGVMGRMRDWWAQAGSKRAASDQPSLGVVAADALLMNGFTSPQGWLQLAQAAKQADLIETELLAWKTFAMLNPEGREIGLAWAQALHRLQRDDEALVVAQNVLQRHPADGAALSLVRQISVAVTMQSGKLKSDGGPPPSPDTA